MTATIAAATDQKAETTHKVKNIDTYTGKVVSVDAAKGKIVVMANGWEDTLQAQPKMLEGIMAGQYVTIERTGDVVNSIKAEKADTALPQEGN